METFLKIYLFRNKRPILPELEHDFIEGLLSRFEMNATALNNYLNCPLKFYYQNLLRVPTGRSEASAFGSAIHFALEKLFEKMKKNNEVFPSVEEFLNDYHWFMQRFRENFTKEAMKRRLAYGDKILTAYYEANINQWEKVVSIERVFKNILVEKVPVKGKLDKLEFDGTDVTIVDYKTGNPENAKDKLKPPTASAPLGGDYWRQGVFYKLLVEGYKMKEYKVTKTIFEFVEPDKQDDYQKHDILPTPDDLQCVREQIKSSWDKIQQHDFYSGCGKKDCYWCNFSKDNKLYSSLAAIELSEEEVDLLD